jgi:hypothetical protein
MHAAFLCTANLQACLPCDAPRNAGISTPPVEIVPLGVEVSAQPAVLSVSNKATIPSDHDAIGIDGSFWVGIGRPIESRVVSRGNLYLAGSITVEPLAGSAYESTVAMVGNGMVGGARFGVRALVGRGLAATAAKGWEPRFCRDLGSQSQGPSLFTCSCRPTSKLTTALRIHTNLLQAVLSWDPVPGQSGKYEMITQLDVIPVVTLFTVM